jgi:uncharacterized Zn-binding protein involved in type VI secretion
MPFAAYGEGVSQVNTVHLACTNPAFTTTDGGSSNVLINGIKACRLDDLSLTHAVPGPSVCNAHATKLTKASTTVFVNGKGMGRVEDTYECTASITTGSPNVRVN